MITLVYTSVSSSGKCCWGKHCTGKMYIAVSGNEKNLLHFACNGLKHSVDWTYKPTMSYWLLTRNNWLKKKKKLLSSFAFSSSSSFNCALYIAVVSLVPGQSCTFIAVLLLKTHYYCHMLQRDGHQHNRHPQWSCSSGHYIFAWTLDWIVKTSHCEVLSKAAGHGIITYIKQLENIQLWISGCKSVRKHWLHLLLQIKSLVEAEKLLAAVQRCLD